MRYIAIISALLINWAVPTYARDAAPPMTCRWDSLTHACCCQQSGTLSALTFGVTGNNPDCGSLPGSASCLPQLLCVNLTKPARNIKTTVASTPANLQGSWELFYRVGEQYDNSDFISVCTAYKWWSQTDRTATICACYDH
jgi:hypothetical protein